jgi:hypothetical protein
VSQFSVSLFYICTQGVPSHMVPYDQPEAALVRRYRASEYTATLTRSNYPGYDYSMGQECSSGELIGSHVLNSMDTDDNIPRF